MSPMGRPKVENPKSLNLTVRLDPKTKAELEKYCKEKRITRGEAIRQGIYLLLAKKEKR